MMKQPKFLVAIITLCLPLILFAEKGDMKFGKITDEEINMTACPIDSNASAVVLQALGRSWFELPQATVVIKFSKHIRIKVFDKESLNKGNFTIPLYVSNTGDEEKISSLKGAVYNMVNGKLEKSKLTKNNIIKENANENRNIVKINMPDVKEGSIIELYYITESPFIFNLEPWYFQDDIPTLESRYEVDIIEWYNYKNWTEGYFPITKSESSRSMEFSYMQEAKIEPGMSGSRKPSHMVKFDAIVDQMVYRANNVPAFKNEPYITTPYDYFASIHFELQTTKYPWAIQKSYTKSWASINKMLNKNEDFGVTLNFNGHLKDESEKIIAETEKPEMKAKLAYEHILKKMTWDGRYRKYVDNSIRRAYNDENGNSADINLNLVALCRRCGLEAYPVLVSTRNHGKIRPFYPNFTQFNHVITAVKIDGNYLLMDATNQNCPYNLLPPQSLNDKGRLVNEKEGEWVDLYSNRQRNDVYMAQVTFNDEMELQGQLSYRGTDYGALNFRNEYKSEESEEDFLIELERKLNLSKIEKFEITDLDSNYKPISIKSDIIIKDGINTVNDLLFFTPKVIGRNSENIFKLETRTYPVDYNYPVKEQYMFTFQIPDGYVVDEIPDPLVMALPDNKGRYIYMIKEIGGNLHLTCQFNINQTIFSGVDYPELKKFYELIVAKEAEQVVLKKQIANL